jgi:hypothetical protein
MCPFDHRFLLIPCENSLRFYEGRVFLFNSSLYLGEGLGKKEWFTESRGIVETWKFRFREICLTPKQIASWKPSLVCELVYKSEATGVFGRVAWVKSRHWYIAVTRCILVLVWASRSFDMPSACKTFILAKSANQTEFELPLYWHFQVLFQAWCA